MEGAAGLGPARALSDVQRGVLCQRRLLAAIAALHDRAARAAETDWPQIHGLYELLEHVARVQ